MKNVIRHGTLLLIVALLPLALKAAERVTLQTGFVVSCDHHAQVEGRIRLYLSAGEDNFIQFVPAEIANVEKVPDPPVAADVASGTSPVPSPAVSDKKLSQADLAEMLARAGHEHNLDVDLLASLVKAESGGNPRALSQAGAQGLMQLMPQTAGDLGVHDSYKPDQNVRGGSTYLDSLLVRYHDNLALALAAYNAGPVAVDKYHGIPPYHETRAYVARVIHEFNRRVQAREAQRKAPSSQARAMQN
jgi:soluble lytic murein transglycosylase-like protein